MGRAYSQLIKDRSRLKMQLQSYAACDDADVRRLVRRRYGELVGFVEGVTGGDQALVSAFFATGMMLNVLAAGGSARREGGLGSPHADRARDHAVEAALFFTPHVS